MLKPTSRRLKMPSPPFDEQASRFDERAGLPGDVCRAVARAVCEFAVEGGAVVEVGAGTGQIGLELARLHEGYVGFDVSPAMLDRFRASLRGGSVRAKLIVADGDRRWPVEDGSCRVVFGSRSLHLLRLDHIVAEIARVASPQGLTVLVGRVERERDSVRSRMRREMRRLLREAGHEGRGGSENASRLVEECAARGARVLEARAVAQWSVATAPADSLRSWSEKPGLASVSLDPLTKAEVLDRLRAWAVDEFGDLERTVPSREVYVLEGATFAGEAERTTRGSDEE